MRYCPNATCAGRVLEGIVHFAAREAMDIRGLGYERVRQLLDQGLIHDVADLYHLRREQLLELERFAEQSADQLLAGIAASKARPLSTLLFAVGIRHVGKTVAQILARRFGTLEAIMAADGETDRRSARCRPRHRGGGGELLQGTAEPEADQSPGRGRRRHAGAERDLRRRSAGRQSPTYSPVHCRPSRGARPLH